MTQYSSRFDVIHIISKDDCKDFTYIYKGLPCDVHINPSKGQIKTIIRSHPEQPLILIGHGTEEGLLNPQLNGYIIDGRVVDMLRKRSCIIGIWCYAGNFADKYSLHGFFTSMFISNTDELIPHATYRDDINIAQEEISHENVLFAKRLNKLLRDLTIINDHPCLDNWIGELQRKARNTRWFVRYNYEALGVY